MRAHPAPDTKGKVSVYPDYSTNETSPSTKRCSKCGEIKPRNEFNRNKGTRDGLATNCKVCRAIRRREKPWYDSPRAKAYMREYSSSPERKVERKIYAQSERGKERSKERFRRYYQNNKHKVAARVAVGKAIKSGILPPPASLMCNCGRPASEYHHAIYDKEHWLNVVPLCERCHDTLHYDLYEKESGDE